jgi:hypothetical protein
MGRLEELGLAIGSRVNVELGRIGRVLGWRCQNLGLSRCWRADGGR